MSRILLLAIIIISILFYVIFRYWLNIPLIFWFILLGLVEGLYYGWFNNDIFHKSGKFNNEFEKAHTLYIHIICGLAGSLSLFVLYTRFPYSKVEFNIGDLALLIFGILGIVGLLPRAFWFLANSGELIKKL